MKGFELVSELFLNGLKNVQLRESIQKYLINMQKYDKVPRRTRKCTKVRESAQKYEKVCKKGLRWLMGD